MRSLRAVIVQESLPLSTAPVGLFGLISGKGLYKGRKDAGLEVKRSNASMPVGALLCFVEML